MYNELTSLLEKCDCLNDKAAWGQFAVLESLFLAHVV